MATTKQPTIEQMQSAIANKGKFLEGSHTPMRLYHGTTATEGKGKEALRNLKPSKEGALGSGVYLTPNANFAGEYAKKSSGNVLPVHARITNPLIINNHQGEDPMIHALVKLGMTPDKASSMVEKAYEDKGYIGKQVQQRAQAAGHDALMQYRDGNLTEVVHYNPRMIKSATGNRGTYDTTKDDLSMAKGGEVNEPKNTVKAYKLFRVHPKHPGKLFPLFVDSNTPVEMNQWVDAKEGEMKGNKVKSKIGDLAYRPGWHAGDLPIATHIGEKSHPSLTAPDQRPANHAWAEVEMPNDVDWQSEAIKRGTNAQGRVVPVKAHITDQIPEGGHYRYKTNPNMTGNWLIGGSMKVNKVLTDAEVSRINKAAGLSDLPRAQPFKKKEFGFATGGCVAPEEWKAEEHVNYKAKGGVIHMAKGGPASLEAMKLALLNNEPLDIVGNTKRNLKGAWDVAKSVPGNLQRMVTDPVAYAKSLPAPTGEQLMNMFQPGHVGGMAGVIKPKGGNWYKSPRNDVSVEGSITRLRPYQDQTYILPHVKAGYEKSLAQAESDPSGRLVRHHKEIFDEATQRHALNQWVENNLQNYVKKQMGTPEDPIRALHEEGITHLPKEVQTGLEQADRDTRIRRVEAGYPEHGVAKSDLGKMWENLADEQIWSRNAGDIQAAPAAAQRLEQAERAMRDRQNMVTLQFRNLINKSGLNQAERQAMLEKTPMKTQSQMVGDTELQGLIDATLKAKEPFMRENAAISEINPWVSGMPPETKLYQGHASGMGFDHVIDILKQDIASGRIRPEQLNKISVSDAVRRTHEFDQDMAKKMAEAQIKATEGMPVHKEYPEGYKWIELAPSKELPEGWTTKNGAYYDPQGERHAHPDSERLSAALKYEGDTMGHCVGGYCPDVLEGNSRIFSLRSPKGEPHVTIETAPTKLTSKDLPPEIAAKWNNKINYPELSQYKFLNDYLSAEHPELHAKMNEPQPDRIVQIKGKQNAAPVDEYQPYVQDFVKSGKWSDVGDLQNTGLQKWKDRYLSREEINSLTPEESDAFASRNLGMAKGGQPSMDAMNLALTKKVHMADGGGVTNLGSNMQPNIAQMRMALNQNNTNPIAMQNIGVNEAPNMSPKMYMPPEDDEYQYPSPGGVAMSNGMPIGGVDVNQQQPGQQFMSDQQSQQGVQGGMPNGAPQPTPGQPGPAGPTPPMGNMLSMTPQGQAMQAMGGGRPPGAPPVAMAKGGSLSVDDMKAEMASKKDDSKEKRTTITAPGAGGVKGIVVPKHLIEGNPKANAEGLKNMMAARAKIYGEEHREPLNLGQMGKIHKQALEEHFAKPIQEQKRAEQEALNKIRSAKFIKHNRDTLDESEKLDTVEHEHDEQGRSHVGYASKGIAGHALFPRGHGKDMDYKVINTCPGQTEGCGGGKDAEGIVDTKQGTCFAPNAESQYAAAVSRRAGHAIAKHDPAMTKDWIIAHTGSMRNAAGRADKQNKRMLYRPNVVDETDVSSRHVIRHLNEQRKEEGRPDIIANSYGKTNELHDPENGYHVTHSNVGPKVKKGQEIKENIGRDKARVRNTVMAADNQGDFKNEQGHKTPPKGSYLVTDVKRGSPMAKKMEGAITHAKYWTTGRHESELSAEEKEEGPEGHFSGSGRKTSEDKAHYGHTTVEGKRFDYQKQHILHPRLVQVGKNDDGTPHIIPTDSRFKDTEFLPKDRFKTKNGKDAGHILMTTPTESTDNIGHQTSFTHNVSDKHIEHAQNNNGEYEIDKPEDQIKAEGKEYQAPKALKFYPKPKAYAGGGSIGGRHYGFEHDDFHAFPEQNVVAQRHLAMRHGEDEKHETRSLPYHSGNNKAVVLHKNMDTMRLEMMKKAK
jgi:hypothetical protein